VDSLLVLAALGVNVALSEWLARHTVLRHLGSALLVIVLTAIAANVGLVPTYTGDVPVYGAIFSYVAPLAIFLLLLRVNLEGILKAGTPMIALFLLGSVGTLLGVMAGMTLVGGARAFGDLYYALGGMFVGTYTGGSINFNAVALEYGVVQDGNLYAGAAVVDSAMTTVWMAATVALPRLLVPFWPQSRKAGAAPAYADAIDGAEDTETVHPMDLALLLALGLAAVWGSERIATWLREQAGVAIPSILVLTTLALILAQVGPVQRLRGAKLCGMLSVMVFLAVIGALCDFSALARMGDLGVTLAAFVVVVVVVHGLVTFAAGALLRIDPSVAAVASQANIGGSTSALALARSLGRGDLVLPGILVGSLGNAIGTYLGFLTAAWLRGG
jgi:uncharacterized membrane protein